MVWTKAWLDTRWRFVFGVALLVTLAAGNLFEYAQLDDLLNSIESAERGDGGIIGDAVQEAIEIQQTYRGFVWYNWFRQGLAFLLAAAVLGSGSPLARSGRGLLFTLALPAPRGAWFTARAAVGLAQLLVLVVVPSLAFPLLSPAIGEHYGIGEAFVHAICAFTAASAFLALALLLSTVFDDVWRAPLLTVLIGMCLGFFEIALPGVSGIFSVMAGESYFRNGLLPWFGLAVSAALTSALLYAAAANVARRDF